MKKRSLVLGLLVAGIFFLVFSSSAMGYSIGTTYTYDSSTPNYNAAATIHTGTIDTSTLTAGDFMGRGDTVNMPNNAGFYGSSGEEVSWDDAWTGSIGNANTNGDVLDGLWVQIFSDAGWWDLGTGFNQFAVMTSQDHGSYLAEGLEYTVIGSNGGPGSRALWASATISDIYLDGWRTHNNTEDVNNNGWLSDDISAVFQFEGGDAYRYIRLVSWNTSGSLSEPEVDNIAGVAPVPEPSTILLMGIGLLGLVGYSRKRKKS